MSIYCGNERAHYRVSLTYFYFYIKLLDIAFFKLLLFQRRKKMKNRPILVLKVGTEVLLGGGKWLDQLIFNDIARQIWCAEAEEIGGRIVLVTSGAIKAGREAMGRPDGEIILTKRQLAGVGSVPLLNMWQQAFNNMLFSRKVAMVWVTYANWSRELERLSVRDAILAYLDQGVMPVINENDVVAGEEVESMEKGFSENDRLTTMVARLINAWGVVFATSLGGIYSCDPKVHPSADFFTAISTRDAQAMLRSNSNSSKNGSGGVQAKLRAALRCYRENRRVAITGVQPGFLSDFVAGKSVGTTIGPATIKK
jgi:glutamate 5-kinase